MVACGGHISRRVTRSTVGAANVGPSTDAPPWSIVTRGSRRRALEKGHGGDGGDDGGVGGGCDEGSIFVNGGGKVVVGGEVGSSTKPFRQRKGRGHNKSKKPLPDPSQRPVLIINEEYSSFGNPDASTIASDIVKGRYDGLWPEWKDVPTNVKDMLFSRFLEFFRPEESLERLLRIREIWNATAGKVFRDNLSKARTNAKDALGLKGAARVINQDCKLFRPEFIRQELWDQLCDYWMQDKFLKKSVAGQKNKRASNKLHCCGSRNIAVHAAKLSKKKQGPVSDADVFRATHTRKNGQLIDESSRRTLERYDEEIERRLAEASKGEDVDGQILGMANEDAKSTTFLQREAWLASVGGPHKGHILGYGPRHRASAVRSQAPLSSHMQSQVESQRVQELQRDLADARREADVANRRADVAIHQANKVTRRVGTIEQLLLTLGQRCLGVDFQLPPGYDEDDDDDVTRLTDAPTSTST